MPRFFLTGDRLSSKAKMKENGRFGRYCNPCHSKLTCGPDPDFKQTYQLHRAERRIFSKKRTVLSLRLSMQGPAIITLWVTKTALLDGNSCQRWDRRPDKQRATAKKVGILFEVKCPHRLEEVWVHAVNQMKCESRPILLEEGSTHEVQHPNLQGVEK